MLAVAFDIRLLACNLAGTGAALAEAEAKELCFAVRWHADGRSAATAAMKSLHLADCSRAACPLLASKGGDVISIGLRMVPGKPVRVQAAFGGVEVNWNPDTVAALHRAARQMTGRRGERSGLGQQASSDGASAGGYVVDDVAAAGGEAMAAAPAAPYVSPAMSVSIDLEAKLRGVTITLNSCV